MVVVAGGVHAAGPSAHSRRLAAAPPEHQQHPRGVNGEVQSSPLSRSRAEASTTTRMASLPRCVEEARRRPRGVRREGSGTRSGVRSQQQQEAAAAAERRLPPQWKLSHAVSRSPANRGCGARPHSGRPAYRSRGSTWGDRMLSVERTNGRAETRPPESVDPLELRGFWPIGARLREPATQEARGAG